MAAEKPVKKEPAIIKNETKQLPSIQGGEMTYKISEKNLNKLMSMAQAEGIAVAKARGVKIGRSPKLLPENFYEVYQSWKAGNITATEAASECDMPLSSFKYRAKNYEIGTQRT